MSTVQFQAADQERHPDARREGGRGEHREDRVGGLRRPAGGEANPDLIGFYVSQFLV